MNQILNSRTRSYRKISKTKGTRQPDQLLNQASWETGVSRATRPLADRTSLITGQPATFNTLEGVDLLMRQVTPKWCVSFFLTKKCFFFFIFLPVQHQSLRLSQAHNSADRQHARTYRAMSDVLLATCKWRYCRRIWALYGVSGVPIGALLVVLQQ